MPDHRAEQHAAGQERHDRGLLRIGIENVAAASGAAQAPDRRRDGGAGGGGLERPAFAPDRHHVGIDRKHLDRHAQIVQPLAKRPVGEQHDPAAVAIMRGDVEQHQLGTAELAAMTDE